MKKETLIKSLLILLPVLAVGLATTVNSVTVFDPAAGTTEYYSYFDLVPVENLQMLPPLAATLSLVSGILAAVYLGKNNLKCLKAAGYTAFASAVAASIPVAFPGDILVIPNVALPLFMMIQNLVAAYVAKMVQKAEARKKAPKRKKR